MGRRRLAGLVIGAATLTMATTAGASAPGADVRLSNDAAGTSRYVSNYTLDTGHSYTDDTIKECGRARGRQNEPSVGIDLRNTSVIVASSNDSCGFYGSSDPPQEVGPVWPGYYRSQDGGGTFRSSLVPGYPADRSPYSTRAQVQADTAGNPKIAWDRHGRAFIAAESSVDPDGTELAFGDVWVATFENPQGETGPTAKDGREFTRSVVVDHGSADPKSLDHGNDVMAIEVDRTGGPCDANVYVAYPRRQKNGDVSIEFARSTDHGKTFQKRGRISNGTRDGGFPDIAVTGSGAVYVTFRQYAGKGRDVDAAMISKSKDCGKTFSKPTQLVAFTPYDATDISEPEDAMEPEPGGERVAAAMPSARVAPKPPRQSEVVARECGDLEAHCESDYTFFRRNTEVRSAADQTDTAHEWVYVVFDPSKPGTSVETGTSFGTHGEGLGSQSGVYFLRYDGSGKGSLASGPTLIDNQATGHQFFPDIAADGGKLHVLWWDSRNDPCYSPARPVGTCAPHSSTTSVDVFASSSSNAGVTWSPSARLSDTTSNPNVEQFEDRLLPFAGNSLGIDAVGATAFGVWTDWRAVQQGQDPREGDDDEDKDASDVAQCRTLLPGGGDMEQLSSDQCPRAGGLDQNISGDAAP